MEIENQDITQINDGHYTELLDRVFVASCMIEDHCLKHPLAKMDSDISSKISSALAELAEAYQRIGHKIVLKTKY